MADCRPERDSEGLNNLKRGKSRGDFRKRAVVAAVLCAAAMAWNARPEGPEPPGDSLVHGQEKVPGMTARTEFGLAARVERATLLRDELLRKQEEILKKQGKF